MRFALGWVSASSLFPPCCCFCCCCCDLFCGLVASFPESPRFGPLRSMRNSLFSFSSLFFFYYSSRYRMVFALPSFLPSFPSSSSSSFTLSRRVGNNPLSSLSLSLSLSRRQTCAYIHRLKKMIRLFLCLFILFLPPSRFLHLLFLITKTKTSSLHFPQRNQKKRLLLPLATLLSLP